MHLTLTVRVEASSKGELIDRFGSQVKKLRKHFDTLKDDGYFGPKCDIRFLIIGGQHRGESNE